MNFLNLFILWRLRISLTDTHSIQHVHYVYDFDQLCVHDF